MVGSWRACLESAQGDQHMTAAAMRSQTRAMGLFWGLMGLCSVLIVATIYLAITELGKPWSGFFSRVAK